MRNLILSLIPIICLLSACSSDLDYGENMMNNSPEYTDSGDIYAYVHSASFSSRDIGPMIYM